MDGKSKISCIIPMYNAENYIEKCINSVLCQTYKNFEIIIIDDGSMDSSLALAEKMAKADDRIKVFHTPNGGVCKARNTGLSYATGELIAYLDSDDFLPTDSFEILAEDITEHNADIAVGRDVVFGNDGAEKKRDFSNELFVWEGYEALEAALKDVPNTYNVVGKLFKKDILKGMTFEVGRKVGEDSYFFFECCLKKPKMTYRDCSVYKVFLSENSATRSGFDASKIEDTIHFAERKLEDVKKFCPEYIDLTYNIIIRAHLNILNGMLLQNKGKEFDEHYKKSIDYIRKNKKYYIPDKATTKRLFNAVTGHYLWLYKLELFLRRIKKTLIK